MSKFKVGDRVRGRNNDGWQSWAEGVEFTVAVVHDAKELQSMDPSFERYWYEGHDATLNGESYTEHGVGVVPTGHVGVWENNLELIDG